jgi:hypothetical protein
LPGNLITVRVAVPLATLLSITFASLIPWQEAMSDRSKRCDAERQPQRTMAEADAIHRLPQRLYA